MKLFYNSIFMKFLLKDNPGNLAAVFNPGLNFLQKKNSNKHFSGTAKMLFLLVFSSLAFYNSIAQNSFFADIPEKSIAARGQQRVIVPKKYRTLQLSKTGLLNFLNSVPSQNSIINSNSSPIIEIPMPQGGTTKFHIWESSVMEPGLAAKFPEIKTFTGQGIDDPSAIIKLDWTVEGFHAMILSALNGSVFIDPYAANNTSTYISYHKKDFIKAGKYLELPPLKPTGSFTRTASPAGVLTGSCIGSQLRTYRLALAANGEYTAFHGGTVAGAASAQATTINRVNGVYERDLAIRMVLVANNNLLIYTNAATDPYTDNSSPYAMIADNQKNVDTIIGRNNYDIGHVFSTGAGGLASLGVVCIEGDKAKGVTGTGSPVGDPFDIDYVAHELGHQFGANHTFNSETGPCEFNGVSSTNAEPGGGSTIMAYASLCESDDLQPHSDAYFHAVSFDEIIASNVNGPGNNCAVKTANGNTPPVVNAGPDYIIPRSTPFSLTGSATDVNRDPLTYCWEQVNVGGPFGTWNNPSGDAPLFRSFIPKATPVRFFPRISDVIKNADTIGEILPTYGRTLNFRLTVRDNRANGGGVCFDETAVTVDGNAGPFLVTYPNTSGITWFANDFKTITWDPSSTAAAPINCTSVNIELSIDGGLTFPVVILAGTPNDGTEEIQVPNNITSSARIRITAVGNIFYDISNTNFSIQNSPLTEFVFNNPAAVTICGANSAAVVLKTGSFNGFSTPVNLSATGIPAGTTISFGTNPVTPGNSSTVTLNNTSALSAGAYNITINGIAGAVTKSRIITIVAGSIPAAPSILSSPSYNAEGVSTQPSFNWSTVPGANFYTLEISTTSTFATTTQTLTNITSLPKMLTLPLAENTIYYWRVTTTNDCTTGIASVAGIFKTGIATCKSSTNVPVIIPEINSSIVFSTLTIPAAIGVTINDLNVLGLTGTHSYVSDLTVTLTSPAGTSVVLFDEICNSATDFNINLDDEAALVTIPCPPTGNQTAKPSNPLAAFDGQSSTGTWTITIKDHYDKDGGSLNGWGLGFNNCIFIATPISTTPWTQLCGPVASTILTSNINGSVYQWQVNTGSGFTNLTNNVNYAGTGTGTLQINNAPSSWNGYQYRCVVDGVNSTIFTLGFTNYWKGTVSNAWETAANWSCNNIPDATTDVIINSGTVVVNSNGICRSIRVNPFATITVNSGSTINVVH